MIKLNYSPYGMVLCEKIRKLYLSGKKNREIDLDTGSCLHTFGCPPSIAPSISKTNQFIALANIYRGISVIDIKHDFGTVFKYRPHTNANSRFHAKTIWLEGKDSFLFAEGKKLYRVDMTLPFCITCIFNGDDSTICFSDKPSDADSYIMSFDIIGNDALVVYYRPLSDSFLLRVDVETGKVNKLRSYSQISPDEIIADQFGGYYLLTRNYSVLHHVSENREDDLSTTISMGNTMAVSHNGGIVAIDSMLFHQAVLLYETKSWNLIASIPVAMPISSIAFSELDEFLLICEKKPIIWNIAKETTLNSDCL